MRGHPEGTWSLGRLLRQLFVMMSLSLLGAGCQTTQDQPEETQEQKVLESQKALIRNALDSGKPQTILQNLRALIREYPEDASLQSLMGFTQLALKNAPRAIQHFQIAYKLEPTSASGLNLSSAYLEAGDYGKATTLLKALLKKAEREDYANRERIMHNLGYVHERQKQLTKAEYWFQQALEENPTYYPSYMELGRLFERTRRPAMAMKAFQQASDYCPVCLDPVQTLSTLYMKSGRFGDARVMIMRYLRHDNVAPEDKAKATQLLKLANGPTAPGAPKVR